MLILSIGMFDRKTYTKNYHIKPPLISHSLGACKQLKNLGNDWGSEKRDILS
jgi:hypothetical protein